MNFGAAETPADRSIDAPRAFVETNVVGTFEFFEASRRPRRRRSPRADRAWSGFVQVSTDEVYGSLGPVGAFTEQTPYAPRSPYSATKAAGDHLVRAYHETYGLPVLLTNGSNSYGPHQYFRRSSARSW